MEQTPTPTIHPHTTPQPTADIVDMATKSDIADMATKTDSDDILTEPYIDNQFTRLEGKIDRAKYEIIGWIVGLAIAVVSLDKFF